MIGVIAATGMAALPQSGFVAALAACAPHTEAAAVACLDRLLPKKTARDLSRTRYIYVDSTGDYGLADRVGQAWFSDQAEIAKPTDALHRDMALFRDGEGGWNRPPGLVMLESYWLSKNGCALDLQGRARHARVARKRDEAEALAEAREQASAPEVHFSFAKAEGTISRESYHPRCLEEVIP